MTKSKEDETEEGILCRRLQWEVQYCGRKEPNCAISIEGTFQSHMLTSVLSITNKETNTILFVILLPMVLHCSRAPTDTVARITGDRPKINSTLLQDLISSQAHQVKDQGLAKIFCYPK